MGSKHLNYRIGIDVGLNSVGLAAIEIDDSNPNPLEAYPIKILNSMSVIHDGGVDPKSNNKAADSRKKISGAARRIRRMGKRRRERLAALDRVLGEYGYPVERAREIKQWADERDVYLPWHARVEASSGYIENETERKLAVAVALRHIARHCGWRNPYSRFETLDSASQTPSPFYDDFFCNVQLWKRENGIEVDPRVKITVDSKGKTRVELSRWDSSAATVERPTVAELAEVLMSDHPQEKNRLRKTTPDASVQTAQIGKLHQSDSYYEAKLILEKQKVNEDEKQELLKAVFAQVNPRDVGAASEATGKDPLQPSRQRASRASLAFQRYRILATISNLRIKLHGSERKLDPTELNTLYDFLCTTSAALDSDLSWTDVAEVLGVERNELRGVGGTTMDGDPISAKKPPILDTLASIEKADGIKKELKPLKDWWDIARPLEREFLISLLGNAGVNLDALTDVERAAYESSANMISSLEGTALEKLESIKLVAGRAAYSIDTLSRLCERMLAGENLHEARKTEFGVGDDWRPAPEPLGAPTGSPSIDRTIMIVSRWIAACVTKWGVPQTVNIEHVRDGFKSPHAVQTLQREMNSKYEANLLARYECAKELSDAQGIEVPPIAVSRSDVRRNQAIQRQNCQCLYCGREINAYTAEMDHIVPRKGQGSSNDRANLVAVCRDCNKRKSNRLFSSWATPEQKKAALERLNGWIRDPRYFTEKQFRSYKKDVRSRLLQKEADEPIDNRSIESVAWMARVLADQVEGYLSSVQESDCENQRVFVFRGQITSSARRASGLENGLPWYGGGRSKTRLDRRHHAVDAAVIAFMRPSVARVLAIRDEMRISERYSEDPESWGSWKEYEGDATAKRAYVKWRDEQMLVLRRLLSESMSRGRVLVTSPLRLRYGFGAAHEDTVMPLYKKPLSSEFSRIAIDKASTPALWTALTSLPDFDQQKGLPANQQRTMRLHDRIVGPDFLVPLMCAGEDESNTVTSAIYMPVNKGYAKIGNALHHLRIYRVPKFNSKGKQTGWTFEGMRVFQCDLASQQEGDLFAAHLKPSSISVRSVNGNLRDALFDGSAEYLGWVVVGDEIVLDLKSADFSPERKGKLNKLLKAFPGLKKFKVTGINAQKGTSRLAIVPRELSAEGLEPAHILDEIDRIEKRVKILEADPDKLNPRHDGAPTAEEAIALARAKIETLRRREELIRPQVYSGENWTLEDVKEINAAIEKSVTLTVQSLFSTDPTIVRRSTLGYARWSSDNHMPVSWKPSQRAK